MKLIKDSLPQIPRQEDYSGWPAPLPLSNEQRLRDAGVEFDFFVDSCEGPAYAFDEETVVKRAESARKRLVLETLPRLGETALK